MKKLRPYQHNSINEAWAELKKNDHPVLFEMSVGGGKSICIGTILKTIENHNKRALCLVSSAELVRNNATEFKELNGDPSVFCASLAEKSWDKNVIFASPQSIINAIKNNHPIADITFNIIIVDECHLIAYKNPRSVFMQIIRHYKQAYHGMRLLGFTGTPFRGEESIVSPDALFKTKVANISTKYLIDHGYLVPPVFGFTEVEGFDFSKCTIQRTGDFKGSDLQKVVDDKKRLTYDILQEVQKVMATRNVCVVFCSTRKHCYEALNALPQDKSAIILGDTSSEERNRILTAARNKEINYLISVNCLMTGVNVPVIDCIAWLRPTSSFLLYIQGIGRGLRLAPDKKDCIILDYGGNAVRFQDFDDPIINEAVSQTLGKQSEPVFECPVCSHMNNEHTRRCHGRPKNKRCDYFFVFKECPNCQVENDLSARVCRGCDHELIDPNAKLTDKPYGNQTQTPVLSCEYKTKDNIFFARYYVELDNGQNTWVHERFILSSTASIRYFYGSFMKPLTQDASALFRKLPHTKTLFSVAQLSACPRLLLIEKQKDVIKIKKRIL